MKWHSTSVGKVASAMTRWCYMDADLWCLSEAVCLNPQISPLHISSSSVHWLKCLSPSRSKSVCFLNGFSIKGQPSCFSVFSDLNVVTMSPAGCFSRLCMLCFTVFFWTVFYSDVNACWTSLHGYASSCTQRCSYPLPALLRHRCTLLSASGITVSTLFKMAQ